jgi:hypothetical protein
MPVMAEPKKKPAGKRKPPKRTGKPLNVWLPEPLVAALEAYVTASRPRTSKAAVTEVALEEFLKKHGHWPPAPPPPADPPS